jgi:hypothetical protein
VVSKVPSVDVLATPRAMPSSVSWTHERPGNVVPETVNGWPSVGLPLTDSDAPAASVDRNGSIRVGMRRRIGSVASQFRAREVRGVGARPAECPLDPRGGAERTDDGSDLYRMMVVRLQGCHWHHASATEAGFRRSAETHPSAVIGNPSGFASRSHVAFRRPHHCGVGFVAPPPNAHPGALRVVESQTRRRHPSPP